MDELLRDALVEIEARLVNSGNPLEGPSVRLVRAAIDHVEGTARIDLLAEAVEFSRDCREKSYIPLAR